MKLTYIAESLEDIARLFDERARMCDDQAKTNKLRTDKHRFQAQSVTWSAAAEILRQTELKTTQ